VRVSLWTNIQLAARDRPIPVFTAWSLRCYTGHTIAVSPLCSPLALESLLESLLDSLLGSLLERAALDKAALRCVESLLGSVQSSRLGVCHQVQLGVYLRVCSGVFLRAS